MSPTENRRYRKPAADYLGLPWDHPAVVALAWQAAQAADLAAFAVLREGAQRATGRGNNDALPQHLAGL